ncbi:diacylglycerol kinase family protein [Malacoplasma iowae]|uniref:Diacylglycerol kinase n=2 Tax=Malacoplasma iowae TaxID=2116 RepID=A0A084U3A7_MALIO|nr:diacylglycerol kinase family protein [Malacoplasma iowae]VEU62636.1 diacylglycerol kinase [Mycoplasmopsis fermentans]EGZ31291.1 diacylglycerol kinase [Malacoplasma iowae 695]KFB07443.1 diacylglycerol kinase [Malacoplasma iowae DK-CPA]QHG89696.2 diacylglycerol kinase family protein [Malacoplasma iowae 695]WPL35513.1 diacylglycerol kinase family protein [Malacoplasma iowae]
MSNKNNNQFVAILKKFLYAFRGLVYAIKEEKSLVIHFIVSVIVLTVAGIINKQMKTIDWIILVIVIFLVIGVELINTAIENIVDMISFKYNFNARKIKDISAAASLVFSLMSVIVGLLIFIPKFIVIFNQISSGASA